MPKATRPDGHERALLESRLAYHLRCLREDATDPEMSTRERLALVRDRMARIRELRHEMQAAQNTVHAKAG